MLLMMLACEPGVTPSSDQPEILFEVPAGSSARGLGGSLAAVGVVGSASRWEWFLRLGADGSCIKAGRHKLKVGMKGEEILAALCGVPVPKDEPFTVVEGWRIRDIDAALVEKGWIKAGAYIEATSKIDSFKLPFTTTSLEGYLYPETYKVEPDSFDPALLAQRQLDTFVERFYTPYQQKLGTRSLNEVVVMASLLEREEPTPANRPLVAGILWKRIDARWNLGVDATSRYSLDNWNDRTAFLKKLRDPTDPYNTRLRGGLPPTAIGAASLDSLVAATAPVPSEYWYYLHDASKTLHPAKDEAGHEANRRRYNVY